MTDQQSEMDQQTSRSQEQPAKASANAAAIGLGLEFLFSRRHQAAWSLGPLIRESASWVTAYVLARLGEIPPHHLSFTQRQQLEESLDWLMEARTPQAGWAFGTADDADSTAWAVAALRQYGRPVPQGALQLIHRCHRPDGSFAMHPESANNAVAGPGAADVTAIAVRALSAIDAASSEYLAGHLRTDIDTSHGRISSAFFVSSTLMDWKPCMAPWFVVNAVHQLVGQEAEGAWEQALLLRCRMRLQLQSAWPLAAALRRLQRPDGSWPGSARLTTFQAASGNGSAVRPEEHFDEEGVLATVTALSALAIGDLQPGLYFGSDLPFRRL